MGNPEVHRFTEGAYAIEAARWEELNTLDIKNHPKETEFLRISTKAKSTMERMREIQKMPNSYPALGILAEEVIALREEAIAIRTEVTNDNIAKSWNVPSGQAFEDVMESEIEAVMSTLGESLEQKLRPKFDQVIKTLGTDTDPFEDQWKMLGNIKESREFLDEVQKTKDVTPQLVALAQRLRSALDLKTTANPTVARSLAQQDWNKQTFAGKNIDMKPLRVLGGMLGAVITTFGLAQTILSKNHELSPATVGWGMATMFFVNPDLFMKDSSNRALDFIASLGSKNINDLVDKGFRGAEGKEAFEELQAYRKNTTSKNTLEALQKPDRLVEAGDLTELTGDETTSLYKILMTMPVEDRSKALNIFGQAMTRDEQELMSIMLENR